MLVSVTVLAVLAAHSCRLPSWIVAESTEIVHSAESAIDRSAETMQEFQKSSALTQESQLSWPGIRTPIRASEPPTAPLPELQKTIDMQIVDQLSLEEAGRLIAVQTGITITVADDIRGTTLADISWHGAAAGALDYLATRLGFRWRVRDGRVQIYYTDHQSWTIYAPVVSAQWQATVGLSGQVSGGGGGSDLQAKDQVVVTMDTADFWPQLETTIAGLLSPAGRSTLNRQTGELNVVDTPAALSRVDEWVIGTNRELTAQVLINVELYEIDRSADAITGFNFDGILQEALGSSTATIEFGSDDTGSLFGLRLTPSSEDEIDRSDISLILRKAAAGSQVAKLTSTVLRGMNGHPIPVFFGDETSYLERRDVVHEEGLTTVRLVPGKLQDGIALNILPRILPDTDRLSLNITVRTTRIKGISRFPADAGPNDPVIQLPDLESRSVLLPALLRSGETLFVAGLDTSRTNDSSSSGILSNQSQAESRRSSLVLLITPHIVRTPLEIVHSSRRSRLP